MQPRTTILLHSGWVGYFVLPTKRALLTTVTTVMNDHQRGEFLARFVHQGYICIYNFFYSWHMLRAYQVRIYIALPRVGAFFCGIAVNEEVT